MGETDLDARGLVILGLAFLSTLIDGLPKGGEWSGEWFGDPVGLAPADSELGGSSEVPSRCIDVGLGGCDVALPDPNCSKH